MKSINLKILFFFLISFIYAIVRYNVFGNVPWEEVPLYITNKAISLTIVFLLLFSVKKSFESRIRKRLFTLIFILAAIHVFISFRLLGPEHYNKFYSGNELNLVGYLTIFFGISAFIGILILKSDNLLPTENGKLQIPNSLKIIIQKLIPISIALHLFSMRFLGWVSPNTWPAFLIPISLIGFAIIGIYIKLIFTRKL